MIDTHTHILPGIDDGAQTVEESIEIIQVLIDQGISELIATPHIISGVYDNTEIIISEKIEQLEREITRNKLAMKVHMGAELYCEPHILKNTIDNKFTLAKSNYVLIESDLERFPANFEDILFKFQQNGFKPILAHAERFVPFMNDLDYLLSIINRDIFVQMNSGSILGVYGNTVKQTALEMLQCGAVHVIASDVHGLKKRPILMKDAYEFVSETLSEDKAEILFYENPMRIINNEHMISIHEGYFEEPPPKTSFASRIKNIFKR